MMLNYRSVEVLQEYLWRKHNERQNRLRGIVRVMTDTA